MNQQLNWDLDVLTAAVSYRNLSSASANIEMSQPQLSRIIAKLESDYSIALLDRKSRRHTCWTDAAKQLATKYTNLLAHFKSDLLSLRSPEDLRFVTIGSLEGLAVEALKLAEQMFSISSNREIMIVIDDLGILESKFLKGEIDLMLSSRIPGKSKSHRSYLLGYQEFELKGIRSGIPCLSDFERLEQSQKVAQSRPTKLKKGKATLYSNSLRIKELWIDSFGGQGFLPSQMVDKKKSHMIEVLAIASESLPDSLWNKLNPHL